MKKYSLFVYSLLLSFSLNSFAKGEKFNMDCVTETPTTSFIMRTEGDKMIVSLYHHNGEKFAPIHHGVITGSDLTFLTKKYGTIKKIGSFMKFEWPLKNCEKLMNEEPVFSCFGNGKIIEPKIPNSDAFAIYSSLNIEKSFAGKFEFVDLNIDATIDGQQILLPMRFQSYECKSF